MLRTAAAVALVLVAACAAQKTTSDAPPPSAQGGASVSRPEIRAGDSWTYRQMDYARNVPGPTYELRVTFAGPEAIHAVSIGDYGRETDTTFTSEWNEVVSAAGRINVREKGELQFPLHVGATYELRWVVEDPKHGRAGRHERKVKVAGWEEISVPAGKFRALKVESVGTYERFGGGSGGGAVREVVWYVPEIKRWARRLLEESAVAGGRGYLEKSGEELIAFKLQ